MNLIDEIIEIDIDLASMAQSPLVHRTFACFLKIIGTENTFIVNKSNLEDSLTKVHNDYKEVLNIWFKSGGTSLTVYSNDLTYLASLEEIAEHNVIFAGNSADEQLAIYNALTNPPESTPPQDQNPVEQVQVLSNIINTKATAKTILVDKYLYFTVNNNFHLENYPKGRGIFCILSNESISTLETFEYLAPYTQVDYYRKNNFETSSLQGLNLKTLSFLTANNLGALVYFPELKENKFYNMVDLVGFGLNRDFLVKDLEYKIKNRCLTTLANGNSYADGTLAKLDNVMASCTDFYVGINMIESYKTFYLPKAKQQPEDVVNGLARGFKVSYKPVDELKKIQVNLQEEI